MQFLIADTFTDSLARLMGDEQKQVKLTVMNLQLDPSHPSLQFHKLGKARDPRFWSIRAGSDIRVIVHRVDGAILVCYVDHHDKAYDWAERRKLVTHPRTGAAQLVEIRETVQEILVPMLVATSPIPSASLMHPKVPVLGAMSENNLLTYGVPQEWIADVLTATEDELLIIAEHLPAEAAEAVLERAVGGKPRVPAVSAPHVSPFDHPDALRRFRVFTDVASLQAALDYPWEKWTVFLHPDQRQLVDRAYAGPARVA